MPLSTLTPLARRARERGEGLAAFNVVHVENAEAFVAAAVRAGTPVVLQISQNAARYHGALAPIGRAALEIARGADTEVVVHLDHADDLDLVHEALALGFTSVMYDGSRLPEDENRARTAAVVAAAHALGVSVEAELGEVGGKDGVHSPTARTDPAEAARFVAETGVDLLAVAVGSSHAMTSRSARLDEELIRALAAAVPVPLVLHGSSGVADADLQAAIRAGMTKINVSTHLNVVYTGAVRDFLREHPRAVDTRAWMRAGREAGAAEAQRLMELFRDAAPVAAETSRSVPAHRS